MSNTSGKQGINSRGQGSLFWGWLRLGSLFFPGGGLSHCRSTSESLSLFRVAWCPLSHQHSQSHTAAGSCLCSGKSECLSFRCTDPGDHCCILSDQVQVGLATPGERPLSLVPVSEDGGDTGIDRATSHKGTSPSTPLPNYTKHSLAIIADEFCQASPPIP